MCAQGSPGEALVSLLLQTLRLHTSRRRRLAQAVNTWHTEGNAPPNRAGLSKGWETRWFRVLAEISVQTPATTALSFALLKKQIYSLFYLAALQRAEEGHPTAPQSFLHWSKHCPPPPANCQRTRSYTRRLRITLVFLRLCCPPANVPLRTTQYPTGGLSSATNGRILSDTNLLLHL